MADKLVEDAVVCPSLASQMFGYLHPSISKDAETALSPGVEKKVPRVVGGTEITPYSQRATTPRPPPPPWPYHPLQRSSRSQHPGLPGPREQPPPIQRPMGPFQGTSSCLPLTDTFLSGKELLTAVMCDGIAYIKIILLGKKLQVLYIC